MKKKIILFLSLASALLGCLGLAACKPTSKIEDLEERGYTVSVTYDANGGTYLNRPGVSIMDMFNPDNFETDSNGEIHILLTEPTAASRPTSSSSTSITLRKDGYFFAGWYETRTVKTVEGTPVDENGRELILQEDGTYLYADPTESEKNVSVTPAYEYDGYWDFDATWDIKPSEIESTLSKTLYAGWVPYYEFNYYYQKDGAWTQYATTKFDYKTTNAEGSKTSDKDTIWLPRWQDGMMQHEHAYANESVYTFPKQSGMTFSTAYLDAACTQELTQGSFEHRGTLDYEHALALNRVENIYVVFEEGERYQIETAKQLQDNFNLNGLYEIKADLDFAEYTWPAGFMRGTFTGKMYASEGNTFAIKNVDLKYASSSSASYGGLFGELGAGAEIKNLSFENITLDMASVTLANDSNFGLFAGYIQETAVVSGVSVGGALKLGQVTSRFSTYNFHLIANGKTDGITKTSIALSVYGQSLGTNEYTYTVIPSSVSVASSGEITLEISSSIERLDRETYNINIEE